jgi:hypothetical protein
VSYQSPRFIATGDAGLIGISADGQAWQFTSLGVTNHLYGVSGGGERLMAVGSAGLAFASTNAADWLPLPPVTDARLFEVTYAAGQFVAVGDGETIVAYRCQDMGTDISAELTRRSVFYGLGHLVPLASVG